MLNGFGRSLETILPKLKHGYLVETADDGAGDWQSSTRMRFFLTPEGECFHNATVTGGKPASEGPLALKRELRETEGALAGWNGIWRRQRLEAAALTRTHRRTDRAAGSAQRRAAAGGDATRPTKARR